MTPVQPLIAGRVRYLSTVVAGVLIAAGCGSSGSSRGITLRINAPSNFASVAGNEVRLAMTASGITIVKPDGDTSGATGHYHVFIDGEPPAPGSTIPHAADIVHSEANPVVVSGLTPGWHRLVVVVGNGAHQRIGDAAAAVSVKVTGPSLQASVPATVASGQPAVVTVTVQGVLLGPANGDTSGATGHLHLFVDRAPTPPGRPIPKGDPKIIHSEKTTVPVPGLAPGAHYIWVVLGNGSHVPFDPPVETKVTFTVQ